MSDSHSTSHHDSHSDENGLGGEIIPVGSWQDRLLAVMSMLCLCGLITIGWGMSQGVMVEHNHEQQEQHAQHPEHETRMENQPEHSHD